MALVELPVAGKDQPHKLIAINQPQVWLALLGVAGRWVKRAQSYEQAAVTTGQFFLKRGNTFVRRSARATFDVHLDNWRLDAKVILVGGVNAAPLMR